MKITLTLPVTSDIRARTLPSEHKNEQHWLLPAIDEEEIRKLSSLDKEKFEAAILYAAARVNVDVKK